MNLIQKGTPNIAGANEHNSKFFHRLEECLMDDIECTEFLHFVNNKRNIAFRSSLGNRRYIDAVSSKCLKHFSRNTRCALHPITDNCNDCLMSSFIQGSQFGLKFKVKFLMHCFFRRCYIRGTNSKANSMLRGCLRNQNDIDVMRCKRPE